MAPRLTFYLFASGTLATPFVSFRCPAVGIRTVWECECSDQFVDRLLLGCKFTIEIVFMRLTTRLDFGHVNVGSSLPLLPIMYHSWVERANKPTLSGSDRYSCGPWLPLLFTSTDLGVL